ncbi:conjugal transfer protein TraV [Vibrio halioticoli NBRC 102217]|uniref:Conjugal transfer protein TraV n=1 Tax=Vibrio halioticoli NBRC 102217 TaxID=1219072 RepID=V5FJM2_9VIBR|nr:TraV family lipoprotein [Vibrio halioticoli]GAD89951.1 conjugal transfer protein TraV [Vibrio halioticoli NBRC 102217]
MISLNKFKKIERSFIDSGVGKSILNNKNNLLFLSLSFGLVTGCSIGQSEFNCASGDENSLCASSRTIYKASNGEMKENDEIIYVSNGERKSITLDELNETNGLGVSSESISETKKSVGESNVSVPFSFSYDGDVLRKDVKVLRIWVAPWVDTSDDLHLSTLVYTDIEKRKWEVGTINKESQRLIKPHLKKPVSVQGSTKTSTK